MLIIGIDPGVSGGIGAIDTKTGEAWAISMPETESDLSTELKALKAGRERVAVYLERVSAMPSFGAPGARRARQGASSQWKFAQSYGMIRGCLAMGDFVRTFISPGVWQKELQCLSGGDKKITKARAQELFPSLKLTHHTADAVLIAEYGRRAELGLLKPKAVQPKKEKVKDES